MKNLSSFKRSLNQSGRACSMALISIGLVLLVAFALAGRTPAGQQPVTPTGACSPITPGSPPPNVGPVTVRATAGVLGPTHYATVKADFDAMNAGTHHDPI